MGKEKARSTLDSLLDGPRSPNGLGSLWRLAVMALAATRAYNLGILFGHLVQEGGKCLTTMLTQKINRVGAHN